MLARWKQWSDLMTHGLVLRLPWWELRKLRPDTSDSNTRGGRMRTMIPKDGADSRMFICFVVDVGRRGRTCEIIIQNLRLAVL